MDILAINLDSDATRWASLAAQLHRECVSFQRIPGVLGRDLTTSELAVHYDPLKASWCQARNLTPSEIGCALSHTLAYRTISKMAMSTALILEDDVVLPEKLSALLNSIESLLKEDEPTICLLSPAEHLECDVGIPLSGDQNLKKFKSGYFASAYVVTRAAAEVLLGELHPVGDVADCWSRLVRSGCVSVLVVTPAAIEQNQNQFGSSTTEDIRIALGSFRARFTYKCLRVRNLVLSRFAKTLCCKSVLAVHRNSPHAIDALKRS